MRPVSIYDTTLRDGSQGVGITFSGEDKLAIAKRLDAMGFDYIEGGWPGSNPKDQEFFTRARDQEWTHAKIAAFGSTRRIGIGVEDDLNLAALLAANTPVCTLVGKSSAMQVTDVLRATYAENLLTIEESVAYLKEHGKEVVFDAEHFFDGFFAQPEYALQTLEAAVRGGADVLVLCDTNGGSLPDEIRRVVGELVRRFPDIPLGVHCHNDSDCAVANSIAAVRAGASQVQGTINGYGERCGNANLCSVIPNLELKVGRPCLPPGKLERLTELSRYVADLANVPPIDNAPYVGHNAFAHKGGLHAAATRRRPDAYLHTEPERVGNNSRIVVSELSGRGNLQSKLEELGLPPLDPERTAELVERIKREEAEGMSYEAADASVALLASRASGDYRSPFRLVDYVVQSTSGSAGSPTVTASVRVDVGGEQVEGTAAGCGPVHAIDRALRMALRHRFPELTPVRLVDYKVRVLESDRATEARIRVLIESTDGTGRWGTVGSSNNIIEASYRALADALEFGLLKRSRKAITSTERPFHGSSYRTAPR